MNKLTNEEIARIFLLYWQQPFVYDGSFSIQRVVAGITKGWNIIDDNEPAGSSSYRVDKCKLILTTLEDMSDENALDICKAAAPGCFGIYRIDKWRVVDRNDNDGCYIKIGRNLTKEHFTINKRTGEVVFNDDDTRDIQDSYYTEYFRLGISVPITISAGHPYNGKTPIQLGIAIKK